jgi:Na+/H+ antiporter NhaC
MFLVMESIAPPVVDYARQGRVTEMLDKTPFNMFNLVAIVVIAIAAFFLYKRFMDKQATAKAHMMRPSSIISQPEAAPITTPQVEEVKED